MTREEAIDIVKCIAWHDLRPSEEDIEQAIESLEQEPCEDAISRQALIEKATSWNKHFTDSERCVSLTDIQNAPPVNPEPKTGHWINPTTMQCMKEQVFYYCSVCGKYADANKFCPNCGAKMVELQESEG